MRRVMGFLVLATTLCLGVAPALATNDVNLNVYAGARFLDQDFWEPVENQFAFGGTVDLGQQGWPVHLAFGLHTSVGIKDYDSGFVDKRIGAVSELSFGVAKVWVTDGRVRPFLGGGLSFVGASAEVDTFFGDSDDDDDSLGFWVESGAYWRLTPHFNFGFYGRLLTGTDIELFGAKGDADSWELGPMFGWSWPPKR